MSSRIARLIDKIAEKSSALSMGERSELDMRLSKLDNRLESMSTNFGKRGVEMIPKRVTVHNITMDVYEGVYLRNPVNNYKTIALETDGDAFFGSNVAKPADTSLIIFSNDQTYNAESMGAGDLLLGDNSSSKSNLLWDRSTGQLKLRTGTTTGLILDTDGSLQSGNYTAGTAGYKLDGPTGDAEFNDVKVRGTLQSTVFKYSEIQATAGTWGVFYSASVVDTAFTTVASPTAFNVIVKDDDDDTARFTTASLLRCKTWDGAQITDIWMTVSSATPGTGTTTYSCVLASGTAARTIPAGTAIVDYGASGTGNITLSADGAVGSSANINLATHAGAPWTTQTSLVRMGNIKGVFDVATDVYGLALGDLSSNSKNYFYAITGEVALGGAAIKAWDSSGNESFFLSAANNQTWGTDTDVDQGDIIFGDPGVTGHIKWDRSAGQLLFKNSAKTNQAYIDTDGAIKAGAGKVILNSDGITIDGAGAGVTSEFKMSYPGTDSKLRLLLYNSGSNERIADLQHVLYGTDVGYYFARNISNAGSVYRYGEILLSGYFLTTNAAQVKLTAAEGGDVCSLTVYKDNVNITDYLQITDYLAAEGGVHVGGTSDPGTDNLLVDGISTLGATIYTMQDAQLDSAGVMAVVDNATYYRVASYVTGSADNLDSITGGVNGQLVILMARNSTENITVRDGSVSGGNIYTAGAASRVIARSATGGDILELFYNTTNNQWVELSYSDN